MLRSIIKWVLFALALILIANIVPGITVSGFFAALIATLVIGLINLYIKPILQVLTLPINVVTLGLFTIIINAILFALAAYVVPGFSVSGFMPALIGSILFSIVSIIINSSGKYIPA